MLCFFLELLFNQPNFRPRANWHRNAITFANQSIVGQRPFAIFINNNNTIYIPRLSNQILVWHEGSIEPTKIISGNFSNAHSLFVTSNGDLYIDDRFFKSYSRVLKWISETNTWITAMNVRSDCRGLFIDINENLYCSMEDHHQVVKGSLSDAVITSIAVAGTGVAGFDSNQLNKPRGIFVDINLDLYVTDCGNNRVQLFRSGQSNGITVVGGAGPYPTIALDCPSEIVLDSQKYLFIVDSGNHRIVGEGRSGFRCLVGCYGPGSQSSQLYIPSSFSFDRIGNMYVIDQHNHRVQKFELLNESQGKLEIVEKIVDVKEDLLIEK